MFSPTLDLPHGKSAASRAASSAQFSAPETVSGSVLERLSVVAWQDMTIQSVVAIVLRDTSVEPVRGAFGAMTYRPGLFIRVEDTEGCTGHGEVWSNFPTGGAEYKAGLVTNYAAPLLAGTTWCQPSEVLDFLERRLAALTLQTGDFGAMAQICAGIDQAIWDLACRRVGRPFWALAGGQPEVEVYASGIGPHDVGRIIEEHATIGHTRFKIKLGFGDATDHRNLSDALQALPSGGTLMTDVNQAWDVPTASRWLAELQAMGISWCEEPVRADTTNADWARLAGPLRTLRLAAGENLRSLGALTKLATEGGVRVVQPDVGKWGGITGALRLHATLPEGVWLCPHWLSGAIGQAASFQLAAALRSTAPVEIDTNPNLLRTAVLREMPPVAAGRVRVGDGAGLVPDLLPSGLSQYQVQSN